MNYIDQHVHSNISHDGISTYQEHINYAKNHGISEITFTEHFDDYKNIKTNLKTLDIDKYKQAFDEIKDNSKIKTNFGIEIGLRPESKDVIKGMVNTNNFDFIIGSNHITCGKDMAYDTTFFDGLSKEEAITKYLEDVLINIKTYYDDFDVYGHLDYVIRYVSKYYGYLVKMDYQLYQELLDEILKTLIAYNRGIEVNTSGIRYGLGIFNPNIQILRRYLELNGSIITVGSDAHCYQHLASYFNIVYNILEFIGYQYITVYHDRIPEQISIKSLRY